MPGYPGFVHPTDPQLPQGVANRGDELLWVETAIARHSDAGTLDEGNPFVLDVEIDERCRQWIQAVEEEAHGRARVAAHLQASISAVLVTQVHELGRLREQVSSAQAEDDHLRSILLGAPVSPMPRHSVPSAARAGVAEVTLTRLAWRDPESAPTSAGSSA